MAYLVGAAMTFRLTRYEIAERSMMPVLHPGEWALGVKRPRRIRRGDIVVFDHPHRPGFELVKRVAAVTGSAVTVRGEQPGTVDSDIFGEISQEAVTARLLLVYHPRRRILG